MGENKCILCNSYIDDDYVCKNCSEKINIYRLCYDIGEGEEKFKCYSLGFYAFSLKRLILSLKFERNFNSARFIAEIFYKEYNDKFKEKVQLITFVPSTKESLKKRGFNQCEIICDHIKRLSKENIHVEKVLINCKKPKDQIGLTSTQRWKNVEGSFKVIKEKKVRGKNIILIDDVVTTGATAFHCAKALKNSGAENIIILTLAKSRV